MAKTHGRRAGKITLFDGFHGLPNCDDPHDEWTPGLLQAWYHKPHAKSWPTDISGVRTAQPAMPTAAKQRRRRAAA